MTISASSPIMSDRLALIRQAFQTATPSAIGPPCRQRNLH
jgi:hypothetical protein